MTHKVRILLAEDDSNLGFVLKDNLEMNNYEVDCFENGKRALDAFMKNQYDICLLDVMMPILDGFSLAEQIRKKDQGVPIIFLTAKGLKEDKLTGFRTGGDDYLVKPFGMEELLFRIKVFVKRKDIHQEFQQQVYFEIGTYEFDYSRLELKHASGVKILTTKEADLLKELCLHKNTVIKREDLLKKIWGSNDYFTGRSMDVFISRLRKYLNKDVHIDILNHHGTGFRLSIQA